MLKKHPILTKIFFLVVLSLLFSCNANYLKNNDLLYTGAKVTIVADTLSSKEKKELKKIIESKITPKPNASFLGLCPKLFIWNIVSEPERKKGFHHWLKYKVGEPPVLLSQVDKNFNKQLIENYAQNSGYFNAKASFQTIEKGKKAQVHYTLTPKNRYKINEVEFPTDTAHISREILSLKEKSLLKKGDFFSLNTIINERQRIDNELKNKGFYYFHPDNIIVEADSTISKNPLVNLKLKLKNDTPSVAKKAFTIDKVIIFTNYSIENYKEGKYDIPYNTDSLEIRNDVYLINPADKFHPNIFKRTLFLRKGDVYNRKNHNLTLNRLVSLDVFKFVKNEFVISDSLHNKFDAYYALIPKEFKSIRLETTGRTNSANYGGGELTLNWKHRNVFRGAELLKIGVFSAMDIQLGGKKTDANNIFRVGGNVQLSFPRILAPFKTRSSSAFVPRTNAMLNYEFNRRTALYALHNFNFSWGYHWKENVRKEHSLKVFDATLVYSDHITEKYREKMATSPSLERVVEKQLIYGPVYSYAYSTTMLPKKTSFYYKGTADFSANLTGLISGANAKNGTTKTIFSVPYSQYAKIENDVRLYQQLSDNQSLAFRFIGGVAYPYGNSLFVPFSRQFFSGGSNSIRAFGARSLGPGSYDGQNNSSSFYFDQSGDIKLEFNAEYRAKLYKFLHFATFADAGNVWLINEDTHQPGGKFSADFLKEIAVGAGVGLRFDFNILLLRFDLATPLKLPYNQGVSTWVVDKINFFDSSWRKENLMLNIAIGYPF